MMTPTPTPQPDACAELRDLLPAYAIGATTPEESARVRQLLPLCPEATQELSAYVKIGESLAAQVQPVQPPAHVRAALLAKINAPVAQPTPKHKPFIARPTRILAAAAIFALTLMNAFWLVRLNQTQQQLFTLQADQSQLNSLLNRDDVMRVGLLATDSSQHTLGTLFWREQEADMFVYTDNLPPLPADQIYQVWLIAGEQVVSAGTFQHGEGMSAWIHMKPDSDLTAFSVVGLSVEPAPAGSPAPTTNPLALGEIH